METFFFLSFLAAFLALLCVSFHLLDLLHLSLSLEKSVGNVSKWADNSHFQGYNYDVKFHRLTCVQLTSSTSSLLPPVSSI